MSKGRTKSAKRDKALPSRPRRVDPSTISAPAPASFVHIAHVGINAKGMIETSKDLDPAWQILVQDLQAYGVSHDVVEENVDFVEGFLAGAKLAKTRPTGTETKAVKFDLASDKRMCLTISLNIVCSHSYIQPRKKEGYFERNHPVNRLANPQWISLCYLSAIFMGWVRAYRPASNIPCLLNYTRYEIRHEVMVSGTKGKLYRCLESCAYILNGFGNISAYSLFGLCTCAEIPQYIHLLTHCMVHTEIHK